MLKQCPACEKTSGLEIITRQDVFEIKGEKITILVKLYHCKECGIELSNGKELGDPFKAAYNEYRKIHGMVQPEAIVNLRKKYDLTQKELSNLLGFGEITLSRYENGSLQDQAHDLILKFALNPANLLEMINQNADALPIEKRNKIKNIIENESNFCQKIESVFNNQTEDIFNGFSKLQIYKLIEVIKLLCFNREIFKTKLMKLLFYSDFINFKEHSKSITGLKYAHLPYGPVPDKYELILGAIMQVASGVSLEPKEVGKYEGEVVQVTDPPTTNFLSPEEIEIIKKIGKRYEYYSSKEISIKSHTESAYKLTESKELIPYSFAKDIDLN